jgi:hypothetical protein
MLTAGGDDGDATDRTGPITTLAEQADSIEPSDTSEFVVDTAPLAPLVSTDALALVQQLQDAYNNSDWDAVRAINTREASLTDAQFEDVERGYGSLVQAFHVVDYTDVTGETTAVVVGTLLAWDEFPGEGRSTNVACSQWAVDTAAGTAVRTSFLGSDGKQSRRLSGWLPESEFAATAAEYCE